MRTIFSEVPYHQQDRDNFCGLAVVQMLLGKLDPAVNARPPAQTSLASNTNVQSEGTSADSLASLLNSEGGAALNVRFTVAPDTSRPTAVQRVVETLVRTRLAVPALVFGGDPHWVVITGAVLDGDTVLGFFIANPSPVTAAAVDRNIKLRPGLPFPHVAKDQCGKGGSFGAGNVYVAMAAWQRHYWPADAANAEFVTIVNDRTPSDNDVAAAPLTEFPPQQTAAPEPAPNAPPPPKDQLTKDAAAAGMRAHGLDRAGPLVGAFSGANPVRVDSSPQNVAPDDCWELITFEGGTQAASVFVEENTGNFLGAMVPPALTMTPLELQGFAFTAISSDSSLFGDLFQGKLSLDDIAIVRERFWQPCRESQSPFYPFIETRVRNHTVFVSYTRKAHRTLHPNRCVPPRSAETS